VVPKKSAVNLTAGLFMAPSIRIAHWWTVNTGSWCAMVYFFAHRLPQRNRSMRKLVRKRCRPLLRCCVRYVKFYIHTGRLF